MQVDVIVKGDRQAASLCHKLSRRLADGTPQFQGLVEALLEAQSERFAGRGTRWKRLSRATIRREGPHRTLVLTGQLMRSLTVRGASGQVVRITPSSLTFGTRIYYAHFHHKGKGVPRRTVVGLSKVQRKSAVQEWARLLMEDL